MPWAIQRDSLWQGWYCQSLFSAIGKSRSEKIGISPMGMSGLGRTVVYGARRVPLPPARIIARMLHRVLVKIDRGQYGRRSIRWWHASPCQCEPLYYPAYLTQAIFRPEQFPSPKSSSYRSTTFLDYSNSFLNSTWHSYTASFSAGACCFNQSSAACNHTASIYPKILEEIFSILSKPFNISCIPNCTSRIP